MTKTSDNAFRSGGRGYWVTSSVAATIRSQPSPNKADTLLTSNLGDNPQP